MHMILNAPHAIPTWFIQLQSERRWRWYGLANQLHDCTKQSLSQLRSHGFDRNTHVTRALSWMSMAQMFVSTLKARQMRCRCFNRIQIVFGFYLFGNLLSSLVERTASERVRRSLTKYPQLLCACSICLYILYETVLVKVVVCHQNLSQTLASQPPMPSQAGVHFASYSATERERERERRRRFVCFFFRIEHNCWLECARLCHKWCVCVCVCMDALRAVFETSSILRLLQKIHFVVHNDLRSERSLECKYESECKYDLCFEQCITKILRTKSSAGH